MRRVKVSKRVVERTAHGRIASFKIVEDGEATFLEFGYESDQDEGYPVAIVERDTGEVDVVPATYIQFIK